MPKAKPNYIRIVFAVTIVVVISLIAAALFQRQGSSDLVGTWQLATLGGRKVDAATAGSDQHLEILQNGTFRWPSLQASGTWTTDGSNLLLHTDKYDGKTQEQFRAETQAKFPSDPSMLKIADKVFEDVKLSIGADSATLSLNFGGIPQTFRKAPKP